MTFCPIHPKETMPMSPPTSLLPKANLKQLKLPTVLAEYEKLAREAAEADEPYEAYLLRLTELEVASRSANALAARIRAAAFPVAKDFDSYDFSALPGLPKWSVSEIPQGFGSAIRLASRRRRNAISLRRSNLQSKGRGARLVNSSYSRSRCSTAARSAKSLGVRTFRCTRLK